jgi:hypothetical protein
MMLKGYISDNFKIEKSKKIWKPSELTLTNTNRAYGIDVDKNNIDELIMLLQKCKSLFEEKGDVNNEYIK